MLKYYILLIAVAANCSLAHGELTKKEKKELTKIATIDTVRTLTENKGKSKIEILKLSIPLRQQKNLTNLDPYIFE